ncbi:TPA: hypothetical protein QCH90_004298 [Enterobacter asburiae]|nr:hypothetical protein [Enterobacter asburiae]
MKYEWVCIAVSYALPNFSHASEITRLGNLRAEGHQICGKTIDVEVIRIDNRSILLGLKNNQIHSFDLFVSSEPSGE